ncbi:hypothetical protein ABFX02_11G083950 [Erythranthe guttata]
MFFKSTSFFFSQPLSQFPSPFRSGSTMYIYRSGSTMYIPCIYRFQLQSGKLKSVYLSISVTERETKICSYKFTHNWVECGIHHFQFQFSDLQRLHTLLLRPHTHSASSSTHRHRHTHTHSIGTYYVRVIYGFVAYAASFRRIAVAFFAKITSETLTSTTPLPSFSVIMRASPPRLVRFQVFSILVRTERNWISAGFNLFYIYIYVNSSLRRSSNILDEQQW